MDVSEQQAAPQENSASQSAEVPAPKKWKIKVNDQDHELTEDELIYRAQTGYSADKKFQEASKIRKEFEPFVKKLKSGDKKQSLQALKEMLGDEEYLLGMAEDLLLEKLEYNSLSDVEKEALELKRENASLKEFREAQEAEKKERLAQQELEFAQREINEEISEVLKGLGSKPTPRLVKRLAEEMLAHLDTRGGRMKAADAMQRTISSIESDVVEYLSNLPADRLMQVLPKEILNTLRKANIEQVSTMTGNRIAHKSPSQAPTRSTKKVTTTDDFFSQLEKKWS